MKGGLDEMDRTISRSKETPENGEVDRRPNGARVLFSATYQSAAE